MGIQTDYAPDFVSKDFRSFLVGTSGEPFEEKEDRERWKKSGYSEIGQSKLIGEEITHDQFTMIVRTYKIVKNSAFLNTVSVNFPVRHKLNMKVRCALLLPKTTNRKELEKQKIISEEWKNFVTSSGDPIDFAGEQHRIHGISRNDYEIRVFCVYRKTNGNGDEIRDNFTRLKKHYAKLEDAKYWLVLESERIDQNLPPTSTDDPTRTVERNDEIVDRIKKTKKNAREGSSCALDQYTKPAEIRQLGQYTYNEFKIFWVNELFSVGCVKFTWTVPRLKTRTSEDVVYYFAIYDNMDQLILDIAIYCMATEAFNPVVWGYLIIGQFRLALVAYGQAVTTCIKGRLIKEVKCFIPELIVRKKKSSWTFV